MFNKPTEAQQKGLWLAYFIVGAAIPLITWNLFSKRGNKQRLREIDSAHDTTVEDSFPASDPPSSW
jgi:hypothetical protein